jgi:hypothetical protein
LFANKFHDARGNILHQKSVKSKIPPYQSVPMILYTNVPHLLQPK